MALQETETYRLQQAALGNALAARAALQSAKWLTNPNDVWAGFWELVDQLITMVTQGRNVSYWQALNFYNKSRELLGIIEPPPDVEEPPFPTNAFMASMIWTGPRYAQALVARGKTENLAQVVGRSIGRAVTKHVLNAGRTTLIQAARQDPKAFGWARITDMDPCDFCAMLATRGPVYKNNKTAGELNKWHDGCSCTVVPVFRN